MKKPPCLACGRPVDHGETFCSDTCENAYGLGAPVEWLESPPRVPRP